MRNSDFVNALLGKPAPEPVRDFARQLRGEPSQTEQARARRMSERFVDELNDGPAARCSAADSRWFVERLLREGEPLSADFDAMVRRVAKVLRSSKPRRHRSVRESKRQTAKAATLREECSFSKNGECDCRGCLGTHCR